jgi:hypothetical protein
MNSEKRFKSRVPKVTINPRLDKYRDTVLFPEKIADANAFLKKVGLPDFEKIKNVHPVKPRIKRVRHTLPKKTTGRLAS